MAILIVSFVFLTGCGLLTEEVDKGINASSLDSIDKETVEGNVKTESYSSIKQLLDQNFTLVDVISEGSNETTRIYATSQFSIQELSSMFEDYTNPDQVSDIKNEKQAFVYSNDFLTVQLDQEDKSIVLMELATKEFVRNHYAPNYFDGLFALWVLDEVLDVDDWGKKRSQSCYNTGNCYGGYVKTDKYRSGGIGNLRGSTNRGGGPSAGK